MSPRLAWAVLLAVACISPVSAAEEVPAPQQPAVVDPGPIVASPVVLPEVAGGKAVREIVAEGFRIRLDLSGQVLSLDAPKEDAWREEGELRENDTVTVARATTLMSGRRRVADLSAGQTLAVSAVQEKWVGTFLQRDGQRVSGWVKRSDVELAAEESPIQATLRGLSAADFVSASTLAQKAKQFDDGLYAAVELAAQEGAGDFAGKRELFAALIRQYAAQQPSDVSEGLAVALAGGRIGGAEFKVPRDVDSRMASLSADFLADPLKSKPIAFYTWSDDLSRIFRQDRMLQTDLRPLGGGEQLASLLREDPQAWDTYQQYLALIYNLTNPASADKRDLTAAGDGESGESGLGLHFFPPSRSHEADLVMRLYGGQPIPDGFNLADELIARVDSGELDLTPMPDSGWYDYQTWSLETLAAPDRAPESARLALTDDYRAHLRDLCKGIWALTRETHIKQAENPAPASEEVGGEPEPKKIVYIGAQLSQEPTAEYYLRRARGYRFVREALVQCFGAEALVDLHRQTAAGPVAQDLAGELAAMESLFHGAYAAVRREVGLPPDAAEVGSGDDAADAAGFLAWTANPAHDADLGQDSRMMVPVFYDQLRKQTKVWVFLGWSSRPLSIQFAQTPPAEVVYEDGTPVPEEKLPELQWYGAYRALAYPVVAEVYVNRILNRDEFRTHCDTYRTRAAILANLE